MRVDYFHTGNADTETFSLHQVVIEPLPWPGHPQKTIDTTRLGYFMFQVEDPESGEVLYPRGYSSIFQEWQHTGEAREMERTFHESVRFPKPDKPVRLHILKRNRAIRHFQRRRIWLVGDLRNLVEQAEHGIHVDQPLPQRPVHRPQHVQRPEELH